MKKSSLSFALGLTLLAAGGFLFASPAAAAAQTVSPPRPQSAGAARYAKTRAAREFEQGRAAKVSDKIFGENPPRQIRRVPNQGLPKDLNKEGASAGTDAALQTSFAVSEATAEANIPTPEGSFDGISSDDNAAVHGARYLP